MHLEQLLRVLVCRDTAVTADVVGLYVGRMWWLALHLQMQVHRTELDLFSGPYLKGVSAPSRTRYLVNLQRAERLRGSARMAVDYLLVIVTHSCRSYLPITSIASQILDTSKGGFPPIIPQRRRIHHNGANWPKKKSVCIEFMHLGVNLAFSMLAAVPLLQTTFLFAELARRFELRQDSTRVRAWRFPSQPVPPYQWDNLQAPSYLR